MACATRISAIAGSVVRLRATIADSAGVTTEPTTLTAIVTPSRGTPFAATVTAVTAGVKDIDVSTDLVLGRTPGAWTVRVSATNPTWVEDAIIVVTA
jgi:hypothetical protein